MKKIVKFLSNKTWLLIFLLGLVPLTWFKGDLLIAAGDFSIPLDPAGGKFIQSFLYLWYPNLYAGEPNPLLFAISPWFGFWALLKSLGLSLLSINKLWFVFVFTLSGVSMYYLISVLFKKKANPILLFVAPLFYMFNVYVMLVTPTMATPLLYGALPLILGLYIKGLSERSNKYVILIALSSLLICAAIGNPPIYAILGIMMFLYLVYYLVVEGRSQIVPSLIFTFKIAILYLLLNLWWLYPYITNILVYSKDIAKTILNGPNLGGSRLLDTFRLMGSWAFYAESAGVAYFPFAHYYKTPFLIILTFLIPLMAFISVFFKFSKKTFYFLLMAILGILLANGIYASISKMLLSFIPGFWIFREPFAKFTAITAISFAVLIGISTSEIYKFLESRWSNKHFGKFYLALVILVILASSWPILTGDLIFSERGWMKSSHVKIPDYWFNAGQWLNELKGDFRVLVLPENPKNYYCGLSYKWGYASADIAPYLIHQPLVEERAGLGTSNRSELSQNLTKEIYRNLHSMKVTDPDIKTPIRFMNIKYVLQRNDVDWELIWQKNNYLYSPNNMEKILGTQKFLQLEKKIGELDLYKVSDDAFLPHIYVASNLVYFDNEIVSLADATNLGTENQRVAVFTGESGYPTNLEANYIYVRAGIKDSIGKDELNSSIVLEDIPYPYVKHRPGSFFHYLAVKKEELDKKVEGNPQKLIEKNILYAYKRIAELEKWNLNLNGDEVGEIVSKYEAEITQAIETLKKIKEDNKISFPQAFNRFKISLWAHEKKAGELTLSDKARKLLQNVFKKAEKETGNSNLNHDFSSLTYEFGIPREGKYEIYLQTENDKLAKVGEKEFKSGNQQLVLPMNTISENLLDKNLVIKNFVPDSIYKISFNYTAKKGGVGFSVVEDSGIGGRGEIASLFKMNFPVDPKEYEIFFRSSPEASRAAVLFLSAEKESQGVGYRNMEVRKIFQPDLVLRYSSVGKAAKVIPKMIFTKINPTKYKIKIEGAKDPYVLVFSESYSSKWKAYVVDSPSQPALYQDVLSNYFGGEIKEAANKDTFLDKHTFETLWKRPIPEERHLVANGYANSWYIYPQDTEGKEDYEIIIEYGPQKLFYVFLGIFSVTLLGCFGYLINGFVVKRR
jgi:hypothetical protein